MYSNIRFMTKFPTLILLILYKKFVAGIKKTPYIRVLILRISFRGISAECGREPDYDPQKSRAAYNRTSPERSFQVLYSEPGVPLDQSIVSWLPVGSGVVRFLLAILASSAGISLMKSSRIPVLKKYSGIFSQFPQFLPEFNVPMR